MILTIITIISTAIITTAVITILYLIIKSRLKRDILQFNEISEESNYLEDAKKYLKEVYQSYDEILNLAKTEYKRSLDSQIKNSAALLLVDKYEILLLISESEKDNISILNRLIKKQKEETFIELKNELTDLLKTFDFRILQKFKILNKIATSNKILNSYNLTFKDILTEKLYLDIYNNLEIYYQNILKILFNAFPIYLTKSEYRIDISHIYNEEESIKNLMIEEEILSILRTLNLSDAIQKMENIFKFEFNENIRKNLKKLYYYSKVRNHLIHTDGFVNIKLIHDLKKRKITHSLEVGINLKDQIKFIINDFSELCEILMSDINNTLLNEIPRMHKHKKDKEGYVA